MEPILVDDFQNEYLPRTVKNVLSVLEELETSATRNDIIAGLIYILTLESGFIPSHYKHDTGCSNFNLQNLIKYTLQLPPDWKQHGTYKFTFHLKHFEQHLCRIVCCPSLDDLLVNCYVTGIEDARFTAYLDTLTYFSSSSVTIFNLRLQNLRNLSYKVKELVCYPAKQAILKHYSQLDKCLEALPEEIILLIVNYLKTNDFVRFGMTCKRFNRIMKTPALWFKRIEKDLGLRYVPRWNYMSWPELIRLYQLHKQSERRQLGRITYFTGISIRPMDPLMQ